VSLSIKQLSQFSRSNQDLRAAHRKIQELQERIKRLEEAGDVLEYASVILEAGEDPNGFEKLLIAQREWHKAKEAKL
jgi:succinate dehydrogenase/fumarate reductase flavoprotein subunit